MSDLSEMRHESDPGSSVGTSDVRPSAQPVDDWLGDVSDEDWSEHVDTRPGRGYGAGYGGLAAPVGDHDGEPEGAGPPPGRAVDAAEARRLAVRRRRIVAGVVAVAALAVGIAGAVVLAGGDDEASATFPSEPVATTPVATDGTTTTPATTTPSDTTTTPTTPPATDGSSFTLPEGTKLRPGEEADPAVVTELQRALKSVGYDPGPIDGTYGQKTVAAVAAFQQANGLSVDGAVGPETAAALNEALAAGPGPASFTLPEGTKLRPGEEADPAVVTELQRALKSVGYDPGPIDGTYGQKTVAAVAAFQQANGLSTDGAVGPETAAALNDALTAG